MSMLRRAGRREAKKRCELVLPETRRWSLLRLVRRLTNGRKCEMGDPVRDRLVRVEATSCDAASLSPSMLEASIGQSARSRVLRLLMRKISHTSFC